MKAWGVTAKGQKGQEAVSGMYRGWLEEATCAIGDVQRSSQLVNPRPYGICQLVLGLNRIKSCITNILERWRVQTSLILPT